ncbi:hypothetical protein G7Y79_00011g030700 [Physcia stellaris]|nr:hypothetical protein G7Y79_00011g030700 [Physcia stellaris]
MATSSCYKYWTRQVEVLPILDIGGYGGTSLSDLRAPKESEDAEVLQKNQRLYVQYRAADAPWTTEGIDDLFWIDSLTPTPNSPFPDTARSSKFLVQLTDDEYLRAYRAAKKSASRNVTLMNKAEWTGSIMHKVPALTSVMTQVTRWPTQSPKRHGDSRGSMPYELEDVLTAQYFDIKGFSNDAASGLIALVSELIWEDWEHFSVKLNPKLDQYPIVAIQNPTTSKVTEGTTDEYMTRFKSNMVWNTLAREVARYTGYQLVEPFMRPFNNPEYSAFVIGDTSIAEDIVRGAFSLRGHPKKTASRNFILMNKNSAPRAFLRNWWRRNFGKKGSVQETMGRDPLRRKTDNSAINRAADEESDESSDDLKDDFNGSDGDYEFETGSKCCSCSTDLSSSFLEKCLRRNPIDAGMSKDSDCLEAIESFISRSHGVYQHRSRRKSLFFDLQQGRAASLLEELVGENSWAEWQRTGSLTIKGLFNWLCEGAAWNGKKEPGIGPLIDYEFDMYLHHQAQRNGSPNYGWLRTMAHSLIQQLVRGDLTYYAIYVCLRPDLNPRLVSYPYYAKFAAPGDSTFMTKPRAIAQKSCQASTTSSIAGGPLSNDQSKPKARKHDRPIHGLEKLWTPEHAKTFGSFLPVPCQRGDARITLPTIPHGSTPNKLAPGERRRTLLPWYVAVDENDDKVDNEESDDWKTLASAHVSLSGVKSTPSGLSNRFGVIPYKI